MGHLRSTERGVLSAGQVGGLHLIPHCHSGPHPAHCFSWSHPILPSDTRDCPTPYRPVPRLITETENRVLPPPANISCVLSYARPCSRSGALAGNTSDTVLASSKPHSRGGRKYTLTIPSWVERTGALALSSPSPPWCPCHSSAKSNNKAVVVC